MTRKTIVTWIGVVSGLVTILLVFKNPFQNEAKLEAYIEAQEIVTKVEEGSTLSILNDDKKQRLSITSVVKLTLTNNGELPAKKIHIKFDRAYDKMIIKSGKNYQEFKKGDPVYISNLEPDSEVKLFYFDVFSSIRASWLADDFSISSADSGKATLKSDIKGEGVIWYIEEFFIFIVMIFIFIFILCALLMLFAHLYDQNEKTKQKDKRDFETKLEKISHAWTVGILDEEEFKAQGKVLLSKDLEDNK